MSQLNRHVATVRSREGASFALTGVAWASIGVASASVCAILLEKFLLWKPDAVSYHWLAGKPLIVLAAAAGAAALCGLAWGLSKRPSQLEAAARIDDRLGTKEKFSTALYLQSQPGTAGDPFVRAAVMDALRTADHTNLSGAFPIRFPRAFGAAVLIAGVAFGLSYLRTYDVFGREEKAQIAKVEAAKQEEAQKQIEQVLTQIAMAPADIQGQDDIQLARQKLQDLQHQAMRDAGVAQRTAAKAQESLKDAQAFKEKIKNAQNFAKAQANQKVLASLEESQDKTPVSEVMKDIKSGDLDKAIDRMSQLAKDFDKMDQEEQKQAADQMQAMAQQMQQAINNQQQMQQLQQQMQQAGINQQQMQQLQQAMQQAAQGNQQAAQQVQQQVQQMMQAAGANQQQIQQAQQLAQQMQGIQNSGALMQQLQQAAQQMGAAMQQQAAQQGQQAQQGGQQGAPQQGQNGQQQGGQQQGQQGQQGQQQGGQQQGGQQGGQQQGQQQGGQQGGQQQGGQQQGGQQQGQGQQGGGQGQQQQGGGQQGGQQQGGQQGGQQQGGQQAGGQQGQGGQQGGGVQQGAQQMQDALEAIKQDMKQQQAAQRAGQQGAGQQGGGQQGGGQQGGQGQRGQGQGAGQGQGQQGNPQGRQGAGQGGPGQGAGGQAGVEEAPFDFKEEISKSQDNEKGAILAKTYVKADAEKGESTAELREVVRSNLQEATDEVDNQRISRQAQKAVRDYFNGITGEEIVPAEKPKEEPKK